MSIDDVARTLSNGETSAPAYLRIFQVSTASVSFFASSVMATMIAWPANGGLSTPYRRIVFGLSVCDVLQSFAMMTGPLSVPSTVDASWGWGNDASCHANGFLLFVGGGGVVLYTVFLCQYYLCKLKYKMSDGLFRLRLEVKMHTVIIVYCLGLAFAALALNVFHTNNAFFSFCSFASIPTGCTEHADHVGECDATIGPRVNLFITIGNVAVPAMCWLGIILTMTLLFLHAHTLNERVKKELGSSLPTSLRSSRPREEEQSENPENHDPEHSESPQEQLHHVSRLYRKEMLLQASYYVGAFTLAYLPMMIGFLYALFSNYDVDFLMAVGIFFYPLGGFLNILVYTRPKVAHIRRNNPEVSRLRGLWLVLKAGGEIPDEIEDEPSCQICCWTVGGGSDDYSEDEVNSDIIPQSVYLFPHSRGGPLHSTELRGQQSIRPQISSFFYN